MNMKKILITGAGGYIGSITAREVLKKDHRIVAFDNFARGYRAPLLKLQQEFGIDKVVIVEGDITDRESVKKLFIENGKIDAIMHFAALLNVGESAHKPVEYFTTNIVGTQTLLEEAINTAVPYFIFSGSCTVYGNAQYLPIDEKHPIQKPESVYGQSKKTCEEILEWYAKLNKINYVSLRYFNVCGATDDGEYGDSKKPSFHLMQNAVRGALGIEKFYFNYATVNTPDGSPIRDYVNVVDLATAHVLSLEFLFKENHSEIFNIGTGTGNSTLEIVNKVKELTHTDFETAPASERRTGEADKMVADYAKAKNMLGWQPTRTLEQSVNSLITWYKKYPNGWDK
jgi:UDP-glucose 4-epimerase